MIADYRQEVRVGAKRTGTKGKRFFERVVSNWSSATKPTFELKVQVLIGVGVRMTISYKEANKSRPVWKWVNFTGTRPHLIAPKPDNPYQKLFFQWGGPGSYLSKTSPNPARFGGPGTIRGGRLHVSVLVNHPGFSPRRFDLAAQKELEPDFKKEIYNGGRRGLRRAAKKS